MITDAQVRIDILTLLGASSLTIPEIASDYEVDDDDVEQIALDAIGFIRAKLELTDEELACENTTDQFMDFIIKQRNKRVN